MAKKTLRTALICPHCHKEFKADVLGSGQQQGFKCPHCRLFVPLDRAEESQRA